MNKACQQLAVQYANLVGLLNTLERSPQTPGIERREAAIQAQMTYLHQQMADLGCFPSPAPTRPIVGELDATLTLWSDNSMFPGPASGSIDPTTLVFTPGPTGVQYVHINIFHSVLAYQGLSIDVHIQGSIAFSGTFTQAPSGGALSFTEIPLEITVSGYTLDLDPNDPAPVPLSTMSTISLPTNGTQRSGANIDQTGHLDLVGQGQGSLYGRGFNIYMEIGGTLSDWPTRLHHNSATTS